MKRKVSSGYASETEYGYSRAVRAGNTVYVSGTTARESALEKGAYKQSLNIISIISAALDEVGSCLDDVVRTVVYLRSMEDLPTITEVHAQAFGSAKPASTVVEVSKLSPDQALVEVQVTAVVD